MERFKEIIIFQSGQYQDTAVISRSLTQFYPGELNTSQRLAKVRSEIQTFITSGGNQR